MLKTIYKTVFTIEILSDEPLNGNESVQSVLDRAENDDLSGKTSVTLLNRPLSGRQAVNAIKAQGSDTEFFGIDSKGHDLNDE